jgi:hypothetical protein
VKIEHLRGVSIVSLELGDSCLGSGSGVKGKIALSWRLGWNLYRMADTL